MSEAGGFRGYIGSRNIRGHETPQQVQNLVVRSYCERNGLHYLLSATEHSTPHSYMILHDVLAGLDDLAGIVLYSQFLLLIQ